MTDKLVEFRWVLKDGPWKPKPILQVRHRRIFIDPDEEVIHTDRYDAQWSPWEDVPVVEE